MTSPKYTAKLMNNTKWRELLSIIGEYYQSFEVAYIEREKFQIGYAPKPEMLKEKYVADPGIAGGPAEYSTIYALRFPRFQSVRNPVSGVVSKDESLGKEFLVALATIGQLPLEEKGDFIYIYGYQK